MATANKITHLDQLLNPLECSMVKLCDAFFTFHFNVIQLTFVITHVCAQCAHTHTNTQTDIMKILALGLKP